VRIVASAGRSDPGRRRRRNEDAYVLEPPLFAVADGMGGAQAGEVASRLAAGALREGDPSEIDALIQEANRRVHQRSREDPEAAGMGTTMTVAFVEGKTVSFGHVGDSRAYLIRNGKLEQLTQDHSLVGELVRSGKIAREDAETHPQRSVITRAVGTDPDVDVDTFAIDARAGDLFLICSDGLTDMVDDATIERLVDEKRSDLDDLVKALVKAANRGGGEDNITVVAFEVDGDAATDSEDLEETAVVPAPAAAEADEEQTLTEADKVPVVDTMVVSAAEIAAAYEREQEAPPPAKRRRRFLRRLFSYLVVLALLVGIALLILWGLSR
jgi:serine/threonine protein phosphatase PrpC